MESLSRRILASLVVVTFVFSPLAPLPGLLAPKIAHAAVTPISDCTTISEPGEYALSGNIATSSVTGSCIVIAASGVSLDGAGYTLSGDGNYSGVYATNVDDISIFNISIEDFDYGIEFLTVASSSIYEVTIEAVQPGVGVDTGIYFDGVTSSSVTSSAVIATGSSVDTGVSLIGGSNGNTISDVTLTKGEGSGYFEGFYLDSSEDNIITENVMEGINLAFYLEDGSHGNTISHNDITDVSTAFSVFYSDNVIVEHNDVTLVSNYGLGDSSPLVFTWNGEEYQYVADVGQMASRATSGTDYAIIDSDALAPKGGSYSVNISQEYNEIVYYDEVALMTFDHAPGYTVVSPLSRETGPKDFVTVSDTPTHPLKACTDHYGNDCLADLVAYDDQWAEKGEDFVNYWTMDFGDLSGAENIQLLTRVARDYAAESDDRIRSVEVRDENGEWVEVYGYSDLISDGTPRLRSIDLTGKFPTDNYEVRVGLNLQRANYFAVDTAPQVPFTVNTVHPTRADLSFRGYTAIDKTYFWDHDYDMVSDTPEESFASQVGLFTKYGNVTPLLLSHNDQFVVMHHGDHMAVEFPYIAPAPGKERSFMLHNAVVYKHADIGPAGRTVEPLPYQGMTEYPSDGYPMTMDNRSYLKEWNTREVKNEGYAMSFPYSTSTIVRYNVIEGDGGYTGIKMYEEANSTISNNTISGFYYGIDVYNATDILIEENDIFSITGDGIEVDDIIGVIIRDNTLADIGENGIDVQDSNDVSITDNTVSTVMYAGIAVDGGVDVEIIGNIVSDAVEGDGIFVENSANILIEDNELNAVAFDGIDFEESGPFTVRNNTITSDDSGIEVAGVYSEGEDEENGDDTPYPGAHSGEWAWRSDNGNNQYTKLTRTIDLTSASSASFSYWLWYATEYCCDFIIVDVNYTDGEDNPAIYNALTLNSDLEIGSSWEQHTIDLTDYLGQEITIRFTFDTDGSVNWSGAFLDDFTLTVDGVPSVDDVEAGAGAWTVETDAGPAWARFQQEMEEVDEEEDPLPTESSITGNDITSGYYGIWLEEIDGVTVLDNRLESDKWIYNEGENTFDDGTSGNRYYFANGDGAWTVYDARDLDDDNWADEGADLPFSSALVGSTEEVSTEGEIPWNGPFNDSWDGDPMDLFDEDDETGISLSSGTAYAYYEYSLENSENIVWTVVTGAGTHEFVLPDECYAWGSSRHLRVDADSDLNTLAFSCLDGEESWFAPNASWTIEGTTAFYESYVTYDMVNSPWEGEGEDAHPWTEDEGAAPSPQPSRSRSSSGGHVGLSALAAVSPSAATVANLIAQIRELLARHIAQGGELTPLMRAFLDSDNNAASVRDLQYGDEGEDVRSLQTLLIGQGYSIPAGATGFFLEQTRSALSAYQTANAINPAVGYFGPITRAFMKAAGLAGLWW